MSNLIEVKKEYDTIYANHIIGKPNNNANIKVPVIVYADPNKREVFLGQSDLDKNTLTLSELASNNFSIDNFSIEMHDTDYGFPPQSQSKSVDIDLTNIRHLKDDKGVDIVNLHNLPNTNNLIIKSIYPNVKKVHIGGTINLTRELFSQLNHLDTVYFEDDLIKEIPNSCFQSCAELKNINLTNISRIDSWAFFQCDGLEEITFPKGLSYIRKYAFNNCENLKMIYVEGKKFPIIDGTFYLSPSFNNDVKRTVKYLNGNIFEFIFNGGFKFLHKTCADSFMVRRIFRTANKRPYIGFHFKNRGLV